MYTVIDSARPNKDLLRSKGINIELLPFLIHRTATEQDNNSKENYISDRSDRLEQKLKRLEIILSVCSLIVLALAIVEVLYVSLFTLRMRFFSI